MVSGLLLAIREVDEVIHLDEEIVVWGTLQVPCDLLSNPIVTENTPGSVRLQCLRMPSG
jgi:hypothetical protein